MATVTATVTLDMTPPSVIVACSGGAGVVQRVQGGVSTPVSGTEDGTWGGGTVLDYECPQETPVTYTFAGATSAAVMIPDCGAWLIPAGRPELAIQVNISTHDGWNTPAAQSSTRIPGRPNSVVVSWGARGGAEGKFELLTKCLEDEVALKSALADQGVVLMSTHAGHGLSGWMSIGDVSWGRQVAYSYDQGRRVSLPYVMQDRPVIVAVPAGHRWSDEVGDWSQPGTWTDP